MRRWTRVKNWVLWTGFVPAIIAILQLPAQIPAEEKNEKKPEANSRKLTMRDHFDLESVGDPQISPDGERIVYVRGGADIMSDRRFSNLWIVNFDGTGHRPLTSGKASVSSPRWSPQGDRLCYLSGEADSTQIHIMWLDTLQTARITNLTQWPSNLAWSPDGESIAFTMRVPGKKPEGVKMPAAPEGAKWAEPAVVIDRLVYRFDGRGYLPAGFTHIFVVPAEGGSARQITSGDYDHERPEWATDGESIYFSAIRKPDADWVTGDSEIYRASIDGGEIETITRREGPDSTPVANPDRIAYTGNDEERKSYAVTRLYVMKPDGSESRCVSSAFDNDVRGVRWSKRRNGGLLFVAGAKGSTHLHRASLDGEIEQLTQGEIQVGSFTVGDKDRIAASISSADTPSDLYAFTAADPEPRRLTHVNDDILGHRDIGELEEIWYKSSHDQRDIQGWIVKPPHFDTNKKHPLVIYIHGGPHAMYGVGFDLAFQTLAAKDYVVLYTNPRGSTGYGEEFGNIIQHKYPGDDYFDLMSGVDEVIKRGYVDEENLFVTGGSGGGVLTCWLVGRTDRFRAGVSQFPVTNWYSWAGTADVGYSAGWRWFPKWPWEDPEWFTKNSPIALVGNVKTPLLLVTGEQDWRTPISETEQYYRALKIQKKEAVMVRIPDEAHGTAARPSHYIARNLHVEEWFDKHKKGADTKTESDSEKAKDE